MATLQIHFSFKWGYPFKKPRLFGSSSLLRFIKFKQQTDSRLLFQSLKRMIGISFTFSRSEAIIEKPKTRFFFVVLDHQLITIDLILSWILFYFIHLLRRRFPEATQKYHSERADVLWLTDESLTFCCSCCLNEKWEPEAQHRVRGSR